MAHLCLPCGIIRANTKNDKYYEEEKKTAVEDILGLINTLSPLERDLIKTALLESKAKAADMDQLINEERFTSGFAPLWLFRAYCKKWT